LLGRKDLIEAAAQNNNPNSDSIGRGMKDSKEQIVGMVAAVDWFLSQSDAAMETEFRRRATSNRSGFLPSSTSNGLTSRTAVYGPVCTVVWQGSAGDCRPYADQCPLTAHFEAREPSQHQCAHNLLTRKIVSCVIAPKK
jgi:hypothetical protein